MAKGRSRRKRRPEEPEHAVKIYQMRDRFGSSGPPETLVVQQLVKRGNRYVADAGKQKVISFAMFPGEREEELVKAIFTALRGELKESPRHLTKDVKAAVKRVIMPVLRDLGFDGSFWKFRRNGKAQVDLVTFVFPKGMGFFSVNIGKFPLGEFELGGKPIPAAKVEIKHLGKDDKIRQVFDYDRSNLKEVANAVIAFLRGQAAEWWSGTGKRGASVSSNDQQERKSGRRRK